MTSVIRITVRVHTVDVYFIKLLKKPCDISDFVSRPTPFVKRGVYFTQFDSDTFVSSFQRLTV